MPPASVATERLRPCCGGAPGWAGGLAAAGRLGGAGGYRQLLQFQTEHAVVGGQHRQTQLLSQAQGYHSSRRCRRVIAEPVWSAILREPHPNISSWMSLSKMTRSGMPGAVAAQRMGVPVAGEHRADLGPPQGLQDRRWQGRHETSR
jgi:hypothetical protein